MDGSALNAAWPGDSGLLPPAVRRVLVLASCLLIPVAVGCWRFLGLVQAAGAVFVGAAVLVSFWLLARLIAGLGQPGVRAGPLVAGLLLKQGVLIGGAAAAVLGLGLDGRAALAGSSVVVAATVLSALLGWLGDGELERESRPLIRDGRS